MSAAKTGTPAAEICSVSSCSVFVLPVPVAPAIRPCLLSMLRGIWIFASGTGFPSTIRTPSSIAGSSNV